jgi:putative membrane protein
VKLFLQRWTINTVSLLAARFMVSGVDFQGWSDLLMASLLLGVLNALLRPVLLLLSLPLVILTLGLFMLVINAIMLSLVGWLMRPGFSVEGFWPALFGGIVISIVSTVLGVLTGTSESRVRVRRGNGQNPGPGPRIGGDDNDDDDKKGGGGPVIDI